MSRNAFRVLADLLPDAVVYVGRVTEHHDDDTSTVELPIGLATTIVGGAAARGSLIRPRGRTVPVGGWAFVRRGVIETRAPDPAPEAISVGAPVGPPFTWLLDTFTGTAGTGLAAHVGESAHPWQGYGGSGAPPGSGIVTLDGAGSLATTSLLGLAMSSTWVPPEIGIAFYLEAGVTFSEPTPPSAFIQNATFALTGGEGGNYLFTTRPHLVSAALRVNVGGSNVVHVVDPYIPHTYRLEISASHDMSTLRIDGTVVVTLSYGTPLPVELLRVLVQPIADTTGVTISGVSTGAL